MGLALGHANCIPLLLLGRLLLYFKFKTAQTIVYNHPIQEQVSRHENLFNCVVLYLPTVLDLLAVVCVLSSL